MKSIIILWAFLHLICLLHPIFSKCPKVCSCALKQGKKTVHCLKGGLTIIPVSEMDYNSHELIFTAPPYLSNNVTIGRIFSKLQNLETIRISRSGVPAIGDSSFWPGRRLKTLDLSHNSIGFLLESDFNGLKNLQELDLSDNRIFATPSAPFRHLTNLKVLSLARNKLVSLVPRFLYLLSQLEDLDLSGNDLGQLDSTNLQDVGQLKVLKLVRCRLTRLHPIVYQQIPLLRDLDLRENFITFLSPGEFRHLASLHILRLDGNAITHLYDDTFSGHRLDTLGLSHNKIQDIAPCTFCNTTVLHLDFAFNLLGEIHSEAFLPLQQSLEVLNVSSNPLTSDDLGNVVKPLRHLKVLLASDLPLNDLPPDLFAKSSGIQTVNLSRNGLTDISPMFFAPLDQLDELDLSHNLISSTPEKVLEAISNVSSLTSLLLRGNPFVCSECSLAPLYRIVNTSSWLTDADSLICFLPDELSGSPIRSLEAKDLVSCELSAYGLRSLAHTSQVGLIVAVSIVVAMVCVIVIIIIVYRRHIAHYYTHEEERGTWKGVYENPALSRSNAQYSDDKPAFITERVDDHIGEYRPPSDALR